MFGDSEKQFFVFSFSLLQEKTATLKVEQYVAQAKEVRAGLELIGTQNNFDMCD